MLFISHTWANSRVPIFFILINHFILFQFFSPTSPFFIQIQRPELTGARAEKEGAVQLN